MTYLDTDTTDTDWSEYRQPNTTAGRCPLTGVPTARDYGPAALCGDGLIVSSAGRGGRSKSKLQAMFDKFLYQK